MVLFVIIMIPLKSFFISVKDFLISYTSFLCFLPVFMCLITLLIYSYILFTFSTRTSSILIIIILNPWFNYSNISAISEFISHVFPLFKLCLLYFTMLCNFIYWKLAMDWIVSTTQKSYIETLKLNVTVVEMGPARRW